MLRQSVLYLKLHAAGAGTVLQRMSGYQQAHHVRIACMTEDGASATGHLSKAVVTDSRITASDHVIQLT